MIMYRVRMRRFLALVLASSCSSLTIITVPPEAKGDVSVWFINDSQHDLCDLRMAAAASPGLGYNWLSTAETNFPNGDSRGVRVRPGMYKLLAKSCDEKFEASNDQVEIVGPTVISLGGTTGIKQASLQTKPAAPAQP